MKTLLTLYPKTMKNPFSRQAADAKASSELTKQNKEAEKERERMVIQYQIARIDFDLKCIDIGLVEMPSLDLDPFGITAIIRQRRVDKDAEETKKRVEELQKMRQDLVTMSANSHGIATPPTGIVGADGTPIQK